MHKQVGSIGYGKDNHPPMDHDGYVAFIESLGDPDVSKVAVPRRTIVASAYIVICGRSEQT